MAKCTECGKIYNDGDTHVCARAYGGSGDLQKSRNTYDDTALN